jgi:sugar lactone lactonase YvrE
MSQPEPLLTALIFPECPRWHEDRLWLCDWGAQEVIAADLEGKSEVVLNVNAFPFSIDWLPDGRLLVLAGSEQRLLRRESNGSLVTHADLSPLADHPWNELVVDGRGNAYINNIGFDFPEGEFAPGIVALVTPDGSVRQVADGVAFPNGMAVTPDNATLILAESYANQLTAFDIADDGGLANRRRWAGLGDGAPDGICCDAAGAIWYGDVPNQRCVRVREGGELMETIDLDRGCFACMLGGEERRTLFLVANQWGDSADASGGTPAGQILMVDTTAPGAGWP